MNTKNDVIKILMTMATLYDKAMNEAAAEMLLSDLKDFSNDAIIDALKKCRLELGRFPSVHDIISRAQASDGRPGIEEAWAMCPKDESQSAYLNNEVMAAWSVADNIIQDTGDKIAARMAFKEVYEKTIRDNRSKGITPKWWLSSGYDKTGREIAIRDAIEKKRLTIADAKNIIPELEFSGSNRLALPSNEQEAIKKLISDTTNKMEMSKGIE